MKPTKIMHVDDSSVVRKLVAEVISNAPDCELAWQLRDGREVLDVLRHEGSPDVILLDVQMPVLDGAETVGEIRRLGYEMPIVMFSSIVEECAMASLDSLAAGANDVLAKPSNMKDRSEVLAWLERNMLEKVRSFRVEQTAESEALPAAPVVSPSLLAALPRAGLVNELAIRPTPRIVGIGSSTGGPQALEAVLSELPAGFAQPIVIAQHMPAHFTRLLADRLDRCCAINVQEAYDGAVLRAGGAWISPGNRHIVVVQQGDDFVLQIKAKPRDIACRPSVDLLFQSLALHFGPRALAIILTGMGSDGYNGCYAVAAAKGEVIAQDEESSVVWGMPGAVAKASIASTVLPLGRIAHAIESRCLGTRALSHTRG